MFRLAVLLAASLVLGCDKRDGPEAVADAFADAYFLHMDQQKAKEFTALGATEMMDKELQDVAQIRKDGYRAADAAPDMTLRRGTPTTREQRVRVPYEIHIKGGGESSETVRDADIELSHIDGAWKVVRIGLKNRS